MGIKYTIGGLLIYIAIAAYLLAFAAALLRRAKAGHVLYIFGLATAVLAFGYRWYHVRHIPFQNLFEVFLSLGMMIYPVSLFCRRILRVGGFSADMLIGAIMLFPAGFIFSAEPRQLPPALQCWLFTPHVAVYVLAYMFMAKAAFHALWQLAGRNPNPDENLLPSEQATYRIICVGFPLLTLGLILGSCWGKLAWGDWWDWDPKELWSLVCWLIYVSYLHFRYMLGTKYRWAGATAALLGFAAIVITLLWVNLAKIFSAGLHSYAA